VIGLIAAYAIVYTLVAILIERLRREAEEHCPAAGAT
jgi:hypothetical protein